MHHIIQQLHRIFVYIRRDFDQASKNKTESTDTVWSFYGKFPYKLGQDFLDRQYLRTLSV